VTDALSRIHESPTMERVATGFGFTEGALWHPDGFLYFVDIRRSQLWPGLPDALLHGVHIPLCGARQGTWDQSALATPFRILAIDTRPYGIQAGMERLNTHTRRSLSDLAAYHPLLPCIRRSCRPYSHALVSGF
jgi:sugar lactone lactonase YvrE